MDLDIAIPHLLHIKSSDLINNGVDVAKVSQLLFETMSLSKTKLMGMAIQTLEIMEDGKAAFITVTRT